MTSPLAARHTAGGAGCLIASSVGLEALERRHRAEGFLLGDDHVGCHIGQHRRFEEAAAPCAARLPPVTTLAPFFKASAMCASTFSTAFMSMSGPITDM
jgi:hypothetical protein